MDRNVIIVYGDYCAEGIFVKIETSICYGSDSRVYQDKPRSMFDILDIGILEVCMVRKDR